MSKVIGYNKFNIIIDTNCLYKYNYLYVVIKRGVPYVKINLYNKRLYLHRLVIDAKKGEYVDHINGDTLDNRRCNLRICTNSENLRNSKTRIDNTSGYKGVSYKKERKKYIAYININKKRIFLGYYNSKIDAAKAYNIGAKKYHGEFARLNKI